MDPDLKKYQTLVTRMFEIDSPVEFSNGQPSHAAIIFAEMLRRAKSHVLIFCKELAKEVFDGDRDIIPALRSALERNVDVSIIVQEKPQSLEFVRHATDFLNDRLLPGEVSVIECGQGTQPIKDIELNFAVMDQKAVRVEFDKGKVEAVACANNPRMAKTLTTHFRGIQRFLQDVGTSINHLDGQSALDAQGVRS
ncbi:MAG: hypothetical protein AB7I98_17390 [Verrucomicrobiales bacterium]|nr:hypothetical protein [Verrucomicrobiae bacterium]